MCAWVRHKSFFFLGGGNGIPKDKISFGGVPSERVQFLRGQFLKKETLHGHPQRGAARRLVKHCGCAICPAPVEPMKLGCDKPLAAKLLSFLSGVAPSPISHQRCSILKSGGSQHRALGLLCGPCEGRGPAGGQRAEPSVFATGPSGTEPHCLGLPWDLAIGQNPNRTPSEHPTTKID